MLTIVEVSSLYDVGKFLQVFRLTIAPKVKLLGTCPFQVRFIIRDPTGAEFRTGTGTTSANRYRDRYQALSPEPVPVLDSVIDAYDERDNLKFSLVRSTPPFSRQSDDIGYTYTSKFTSIC